MASAPEPGAKPGAPATPGVRLYAVGARGLEPLTTPAGARTVHEAFEGLELGVYSALRTFHHDRFLRLDRHIARTDRSLELLGRPERLDRPRLCAALAEAAAAWPGDDCRMRFDVLLAPAQGLGTESNVLLAVSPNREVPADFVRDGVGVDVAPGLVRARPLIKTARFVVDRRPYPLETKESYEHLLVDAQGRILEAASSNFFALRGGELWAGVEGEALGGITRGAAIDVARELGLPIRFESVRLEEVAALDEAFLTSSTRGVLPVRHVRGVGIGAGRPGPWTERLRAGYAALVEREARPAC